MRHNTAAQMMGGGGDCGRSSTMRHIAAGCGRDYVNCEELHQVSKQFFVRILFTLSCFFIVKTTAVNNISVNRE